MGGRPGSACTPRGCAASPPAWLTARAAPVSAPPRHLRSNPHPQHGLYPSYTLLAQKAVEGAPGEVAALPQMIRLLEVEGAIVTADANGCTRAVMQACVEKKADYVLALKGNRESLHTHVQGLFAQEPSQADRAYSLEQGHGRVELRQATALPIAQAPGLPWPGLQTAVQLHRERLVGESLSVERHYYVSSLPPKAQKLADAIRTHWEVENGLHWVLDVAFSEDKRRIRDKQGAENFALLSRMALMLLKRENSDKASIARKRKRAGWSLPYLLKLLSLRIPQA